MNPVWSYVLAAIGVTGLLVAATRPPAGPGAVPQFFRGGDGG